MHFEMPDATLQTISTNCIIFSAVLADSQAWDMPVLLLTLHC
jgi:hypothetical protein